MNIAKARQIAVEYATAHSGGSFTPQIIDEDIIETDNGWIFFYDSKEFLETNDFSYAIAGNGPLAVSKKNGALYALNPSIGIASIISDFESRIENANT